MKYSLLVLTLIGFLIHGCQTEVTCETQVLKAVDQNNLYSDSTQAVLLDCGKLDPVDMQITKTPLFTEIVNYKEFSSGKYDIKRFISDFQRFSKTDKYASLRNMLILQSKVYNASDWPSDRESLIRKYNLSNDDVDLLESVVKNPANASMNFTEAYEEMNKVKVQNMMEKMKKMKSEE
ncbi:MAG: hypothetical protein ACI9AT_001760 [Ulvibacter sp.]|jgi:hypothetical protein